MSKFLHARYRDLEAYVPGEQPVDMEYIKLNTNESPFPPSPEVIAAITREEVKNLRLYSDPECKSLRDALAKEFGVSRENVFVSNGSDDILNFAFMAFAGNGGKAVFPEISYGFYEVFAELHGINYEKIPLQKDFSIDPKDYFGKSAMVCIANPNAPTGLCLTVSDVEEIVKENKENVVLIDEAYIDFGGESAVNLTKKYDNLLVVQTFSKSKNLAGARLGFAIANEEIIKDLEKIKYSTNPYSINRLSLKAGTAAIESISYFKEKCQEIEKTRAFTKAELEKLGFFVTNSKANFLFAKSDKICGEEIYLKLKKKGILVRHFNKDAIKDYNRITIGTKEQMEALILALKEIFEER